MGTTDPLLHAMPKEPPRSIRLHMPFQHTFVCTRCGYRHVFLQWFARQIFCPQCGLKHEFVRRVKPCDQ